MKNKKRHLCQNYRQQNRFKTNLYYCTRVQFWLYKSYEQILTFGDWAWNDKITYVFTTRSFANDNPNINFINGSVDELINKLNKKPVSRNIWLLGGANLIAQFAKNHLIDECIITEVPTTLGTGIKMNLAYEDFELLNIKKCSQDILQKHYANKKLNSRC